MFPLNLSTASVQYGTATGRGELRYERPTRDGLPPYRRRRDYSRKSASVRLTEAARQAGIRLATNAAGTSDPPAEVYRTTV